MDTILNCKSLGKKFSDQWALSDVNFNLLRGRIVGLLGPNGSGKTTLLKIINGLLVPDEGIVLVNEKAPGVETKKAVSFLPEKTYLDDWMSASEIISFFSDFYEDFDRKKAYEMLKDLGIKKDKKLKTLSKGNKEKVQLILVMSRKADLYCLDEPIGGVDPASRDYILNTIISNYNEDSTILISTHLIADIERILDEVIFLKEGVVQLQSSVDELRAKEGKSIDSLFREVFKC